MSYEEVLDNLPPLLEAIATALEDPVRGHAAMTLVGGVHGLTRFHQKLTSSDLGQEYPLLRQLLVSSARRELGRRLSEDESDALHGLMDRVIHLSNTSFASLQEKVAAGDPYIAALRVAANRPGVTRVVLDLKAEVRPQLFALKPVADYGHRLVLDLYPMVPPDPLAALLELNGQIGTAPQQQQRPENGKPSVARLATVVIDAGHGGEDPGARGRRGTLEKDITLLIARRLKALIDAEPGMRAVLTRDGDYYLALGERVEKARKVKADLLISVHADAFTRPHARGSSVFMLSDRPTSAAAAWLAKQENDSDLIGGVNLEKRDTFLKQVLLEHPGLRGVRSLQVWTDRPGVVKRAG